uniref:5'-3' exoribonuclease 2 n=1 Tax=Lygus hesperus TaxID=30085 RepID=A0A0A9X230_LYGHE
MQYIRGLRVQAGYDPHTSHVIHGMDADLVCLGLSTHEPYISLLRNQLNEVFGPDHNKFCYFNLHSYRQHLMRDFRFIPDMQFERVVDDFVFLCFLVGNDFLPHVPLISIKTKGI